MAGPSILQSLGLLRRLAALPSGPLFRDATWLSLQVELDEARALAWLPPGLALSTPAIATVFVAHFPWTAFGSTYREAGVLFHVRRHLRRAVHCPWMVVDEDVALISGRELLGYPKKLAERIELDIDGNAVRALTVRRGATLIEMRGTLGAEVDVDRAPPMLGQRVINVRARKLVTFRPRERILSARAASVELVVGSSERDRLADLGIATGRVRAAHLLRTDAFAGLPPRELRAAGLRFSLRNWSLRSF